MQRQALAVSFARIFAAAEADGVNYHIVDLEGAASTMQAAEESHRYVRQLAFSLLDLTR